MQTVQLSVDDEIAAATAALKTIIKDIRAKKSAAQIATDVLPSLIAAVGGYANLAADVKKPDNQLALLKGILEGFEEAV